MMEDTTRGWNAGTASEKPRIAIMGEFSAGKSTLSNLLIGAPALPVRVTATQLPPVWISRGTGTAVAVDLDGTSRPVDLSDISAIDVNATQFIRVFHEADTLERCDLIDMPGISDPNMPADVWERAIGHADAVIWCTHATQAWRQSEAAVWGTLPADLYERSLLLLTRFDKINGERDRTRLIRRVGAETEGQFRAVFPISLTQALAAGEDDPESWEASGADAFAKALMTLIEDLNARPLARMERPAGVKPARPTVPGPDTIAGGEAVRPESAGSVIEATVPGRVVPKRVGRRTNTAATIRPRHESGPIGG